MGLLVAALVHSAKIHDRDGALLLLGTVQKERYPRMKKLFGDAGYTEKSARVIEESLGWDFEIVRKTSGRLQKQNEPPPRKKRVFEVLKWRWIVERTFAWLSRSRRLSKNYGQLESSSEVWLWIAMSRLMVRRLV